MKELRSQRQVMDGFSLVTEHETDVSRDCKRMMTWKNNGHEIKK